MALHQSYGIKAAVGAQPGAVNNRADVEIIQRLLNEHATRVGYAPITVNGVVAPQMIQAIRTFQQKVVGMKLPDGRVDPNGKTLLELNKPMGSVLPTAPTTTAPTPCSLFPDKTTSPFGWRAFNLGHMHAGVDFGIPVGTALGSLIDGKARVKHATAAASWGWYVELVESNQTVWRYAHLDGAKTQPLFASVDANGLRDVKKGELIAYSGISGTTAAHLHLERLEAGQRVSPLKSFPYSGHDPEKPKLATNAQLQATNATEVRLNLTVKAADWDLASVKIKLVELNGSTTIPGNFQWELKVDGQAPDRAIHAGSAVWKVERALKNLPQSTDPTENRWTCEVIATTWKSKTSSERFTYKWKK